MPAAGVPQGTSESIESTAFSYGAGKREQCYTAEFYKIPQTIRPNSPFFGSFPAEYPSTGFAVEAPWASNAGKNKD